MRLRQMAQLYLRGSIANETMKYMTAEERENVSRLTSEIANSTLLIGHKNLFIQKLGQTIGGDYHRNRQAAEQEYYVAIWRAVVYLMYHYDYRYRCECCGATEYVTQKGKPKVFDRRYPTCPACESVKIDDPGDSDYAAGQFVKMDQLQLTILRLGTAKPPTHVPAIVSIKGEKKTSKHDEVLNDPNQFAKYFGEFLWNYFRQTLRENEIRHHQSEGYFIDEHVADGRVIKGKFVRGRLVSGPADKVAVEEINSLLIKRKVKHYYEPKANPIDGAYRIMAELLVTNEAVSGQLRILIERYEAMGVKISASDTEITVEVTPGAQMVEATIITPQPVCVQGDTAESDDSSVYDAHQHRIREGGVIMQEDGIAQVESEDLINTIRASLSDGAQKVYDIMLNQGKVYEDFLEFQRGPRGGGSSNGSDKPRSTNIARFLNTSPKQVNAWMQDIKVMCMTHDVGCVG